MILDYFLSTSSSTNTVRSSVDGEAVRNSSSNMAQGAQNAASNFFSSMANAVKIPSATVSSFLKVTNTSHGVD